MPHPDPSSSWGQLIAACKPQKGQGPGPAGSIASTPSFNVSGTPTLHRACSRCPEWPLRQGPSTAPPTGSELLTGVGKGWCMLGPAFPGQKAGGWGRVKSMTRGEGGLPGMQHSGSAHFMSPLQKRRAKPPPPAGLTEPCGWFRAPCGGPSWPLSLGLTVGRLPLLPTELRATLGGC